MNTIKANKEMQKLYEKLFPSGGGRDSITPETHKWQREVLYKDLYQEAVTEPEEHSSENTTVLKRPSRFNN